jgi:Tfp pilus assembly protein PilN
MLRTNLSTRPFYNERLVRTVLGLFAALALGLTLFNLYEIVRLQGQSRDSRETIANNDAQARDLRQKAQGIRQSIDRVKLDAVQSAAREANALIDRRTFSWTELLNYFETTLPPDVRISGVAPQTDQDGRRALKISVISKRVEDLEAFMDALEKTGAFSNVLPRSESASDEDGGLKTTIQANYTPLPEAARPPAASESGSEQPANASAPPTPTPGAPR